jgi:pyruvate/2-oxoglutarate dehydrogenase complex dihydrolipoamide acyltransferase (E2) component
MLKRTDVIMPALEWSRDRHRSALDGHRRPTVKMGEPLMEVETDKAAVEIEAPTSGVLSHVTAHEGDEVPVGTVIAVILGSEEIEMAVPQPHPAYTDPSSAKKLLQRVRWPCAWLQKTTSTLPNQAWGRPGRKSRCPGLPSGKGISQPVCRASYIPPARLAKGAPPGWRNGHRPQRAARERAQRSDPG